jgi:NitT/TauT family transport system substrate-binding protein
MTRVLRCTATAALLLAGAVTAPAPVRAADKPSVTIGFVAMLSEFWPAMVADRKGFFDEAGIKADIVTTSASAKSVQMAAIGAINIGTGSLLDATRGIDAGADIKVVASGVVISTTMLYARPEIRSVAELKGKRVMVGGPKDITNVWWAAMAKASGLDGAKDVDLLFAGATPDRYAALVAGGVDAVAVSTPMAFSAEQKGYANLGLMGPFIPDLPYIAWYANGPWAKANRGAVTAFVKGLSRGVDFIYEPKNRAEAAAILADFTKVSADDALKTYDLIVRIKAFAPGVGFTDASVNETQKVLIEMGDMKPPAKPVAAIYDDSFVKAVAGK